MNNLDNEQGFTLVEMLITMALFALILAVFIGSITALLQINRRGEGNLSSTAQAQQLLESVKGVWQTNPSMDPIQLQAARARFDSNCAPGLVLPTGATVKSQPLDSRAANPGTLADVARLTTCPVTATVPPAMRRIQVVTINGTQTTTLTLDVLRPQ